MSSRFSLRKLAEWLSLGSIFLLPLLILPFTEQFVIQSKIGVLFVTALVMMGLYIINTLRTRVISMTISPLSGPIFLFGIFVAASTFLTGDYPVEHLLGMGGIYLALVLMVLFGGSVLKMENASQKVISTLLGVNVVLAITSALQLVGFGPNALLNAMLDLNLPNTLLFNLSGSSLVATQLGVITMIGVGAGVMSKQLRLGLIHKLAVLVTVAGIALHSWSLLPGQDSSPVFLPWSASWSMSLDTLRTPRTALVGFGPQAFGNAYNILRPQFMNNTEVWDIPFVQGSNALFSLMVTTGVLGLAAFVALILTLYRQRTKVSEAVKPIHWMILSIIVLFLILPLNVVMLGLLGLLMMVWVGSQTERFSQFEFHGVNFKSATHQAMLGGLGETPRSSGVKQNQTVVLVIAAVLAVIVGGISYGYGRAYAAEMASFAATRAAAQDDAVAVYELQQRAIVLNPYLDVFRRRYSITNLAIAAALSERADLTDAEAQQISALLEQAIREGRAAVALDELDVANWINLGQIYRSLIGVADDADQWAVTSYLTAIQLAPTDPGLRIELGGIFYAAEAYAEAAQFFEQAINLKPDLPNGYYNLANAYRMLERPDLASIAFQQTLLLLEPDSEDYLQASSELREVEEELERLRETNPELFADPAEGLEGQGTPSINAQNAIPAGETITPPAQGGLDIPFGETGSEEEGMFELESEPQGFFN